MTTTQSIASSQQENSDIPLLDAGFDAPHDLCYLCPPGTPASLAESFCRHCLRPICTKHNPGDQVGAMLYDACPQCIAAQRGLANQGIFL